MALGARGPKGVPAAAGIAWDISCERVTMAEILNDMAGRKEKELMAV